MVRHTFYLAVALAALALALVVACGLYGEEEAEAPTPGNDAGATDGGGADTANEPTDSSTDGALLKKCRGKFGSPIRQDSLSSAEADYSMRLSQDERTAYITHPENNLSGLSQIWVATRPDLASAFSSKQKRMVELGEATESVAFAAVTDDQRTIYFHVRPQADAAPTLHMSMRSSIQVPFGPRTTLPYQQPPNTELHAPYVTANGDALWLDAFNTVGDSHIVRLAPPQQPNAVLREHLELGTAAFPVVTPDELEIFYAAGKNVMHATRMTTIDGFSGQETLPASSSDFAIPSWISPDACRLYISLQQDASSRLDVFVMNRDP